MKKKWNEKTKKITVITALAAVGVIALTGISLCIYKDAPQKVEIAESSAPEDMVDIPENCLNISAKEDAAAPKEDEIVVSTEVSKETGTENAYVQSLQPAPVKTENKKPAETSAEENVRTEEKKTENTGESAEQTQTEQPSGDAGSPKHGDIQGDKIYIDGFGWIDYNGGETVVIQADDIYENGNKIGIMD